jgi:hypothetical protein
MVVPWGKYQYGQLPQGLKISPDILGRLFSDLPLVFVYINDILIIAKGDFKQHLMHLKVN